MDASGPDLPGLIKDQRADGAIRLRNPVPLPADIPDIAEKLRHWAAHAPDRILLTAPLKGERQTVTYAGALAAARMLHGQLAAKGLASGARLASLLPASKEGLILRLACLLGNFTHIALPPHPFRDLAAWPPQSGEAARLWRMVTPDLVIVTAGTARGSDPSGIALSLADLPAAGPAPDQDGSPEDWSAIFFTAGSTGASKGVPITRSMIGSCQAACAAIWPFLSARPPVLIDWMPWNHVFGGLDNLFKIIWNGGTLHLTHPPTAAGESGMVALMEKTRPTLLIGVPLVLKSLLDAYDADPAPVRAGCAQLSEIFFAGAALDPALWHRLQAFCADMAQGEGRSIRIFSGYGATEAASTMCLVPGAITAPGNLGWPLPGHEVALVSEGDRSELRFRGPNLAPCYLGEDGPFPLPLDDDGYYRTGDAAQLDEDSVGQPMLRFDGRIAEDFKLSSGIKVRSGMLRSALLRHLGAGVQDLVLGGEGREALVTLIFPAPGADPDLICHEIAQSLAVWNMDHPGSSTSIMRFLLSPFLPSAETGEISAKGQLVQSRIMRNHADLFADLCDGRIGSAAMADPV